MILVPSVLCIAQSVTLPKGDLFLEGGRDGAERPLPELDPHPAGCSSGPWTTKSANHNILASVAVKYPTILEADKNSVRKELG